MSKEHLNSRLLDYCVEGNIAKVEEYLYLGADLNGSRYTSRFHTFFRGTPLQAAVKYSRFKLTDLLLKKGADPNALFSGHISILLYSIMQHKGFDHDDNIPLLLLDQPDIDVNYIRKNPTFTIHNYGEAEEISNGVDDFATALIFASAKGLTNIVKKLISKGADINHISKYGSPLLVAAHNNKLRVVEVLIAAGADYLNFKGKRNLSKLNTIPEIKGLITSAFASPNVNSVKNKTGGRRTRRRSGGSAMNEEESGHPHTRAWNAAHPDPTLSQKAYGAATKHGPKAAFNAGLAAMSYAGLSVQAAAINLVCSPYWNGKVTIGSVLNLLSNTGATELVIANKLVSTLPSAAAAVSWYDKSAQAWAATQTPEIQRKLEALAKQLDIAKDQQDKCLPSHPLGPVGPYAKASGLNSSIHGLAGFGQKWR